MPFAAHFQLTFARMSVQPVVARIAPSPTGQLTGRKGPGLYMPLRAAFMGATHGPDLAPLPAQIPADTVAAKFAAARALCP